MVLHVGNDKYLSGVYTINNLIYKYSYNQCDGYLSTSWIQTRKIYSCTDIFCYNEIFEKKGYKI